MRLKSSIARIANALTPPSRQAIERAYLDESVTIADLERRQYEIARGKFNGL